MPSNGNEHNLPIKSDRSRNMKKHNAHRVAFHPVPSYFMLLFFFFYFKEEKFQMRAQRLFCSED